MVAFSSKTVSLDFRCVQVPQAHGKAPKLVVRFVPFTQSEAVGYVLQTIAYF
jgi:hypothetical protein